MRGLLLTRDSDSLPDKISFYHVVLLLASLPFNMYYSHLVLLSYCLHTLIHLPKGAIKRVFNWRTLALQSVFWVTLLSTIYAINRPAAFNEWGKQITILLFPVLFCLNPLDIKKYRQQLMMAFALACTATIIYLYADALLTIKFYKLPWSALFSAAFTNHNFSEPIAIHATFFSMQIALAVVFLLSVLTKERQLYKKLIYLFGSLILSAGIIQLGAKSVFIALILIINIAVPFFLLKGRRRWQFMAISVTLSLLTCVVIMRSGALRERYINQLKTDLSVKQQGATTDSRLARWRVSAGLIVESPIIGHGAGSEIGLLQDGFFQHKLYSSYLNRLNTHSQYLSFLIKSGAVGLLIYLATLTYGLVISIQRKDLLLFTFTLLIACVSLSENLLDVDKGIFFYALFFSVFMFSNGPPERRIIQQKKALIFHEVGNQMVN